MIQTRYKNVNALFDTKVLHSCIMCDIISLWCIIYETKEVSKISNLTQIRRSQGLTQAALAAKAGVARVTIARAEKGRAYPSLSTLKKLAEALSVAIDDLVDEKAG